MIRQKIDVPQAVRDANNIVNAWRDAIRDGIDIREHINVLRMDLEFLREALDVITEWAPAS